MAREAHRARRLLERDEAVALPLQPLEDRDQRAMPRDGHRVGRLTSDLGVHARVPRGDDLGEPEAAREPDDAREVRAAVQVIADEAQLGRAAESIRELVSQLLEAHGALLGME